MVKRSGGGKVDKAHKVQKVDALNTQWTGEDNRRFVRALEAYGTHAPPFGAQDAWKGIADAVGTKSVETVQRHAQQHLLQLQLLNSTKEEEYEQMRRMDAAWTMEEDRAFEALLAEYSSAVCYPWADISRQLPGKSQRAVQGRYQKLCFDIARIETGQQVTMLQARTPTPMTASEETLCEDIDGSGDHIQDCIVTLTPTEEELLVEALEEAHVLPCAPAGVLNSVASAVAAFANSNGKVPPQRAVPRFSKQDATIALNQLMQAKMKTPRAALEELVQQLSLQPTENMDSFTKDNVMRETSASSVVPGQTEDNQANN